MDYGEAQRLRRRERIEDRDDALREIEDSGSDRRFRIIPANPEFYRLAYHRLDNTSWHEKVAILAWRIDEASLDREIIVTPICVEGLVGADWETSAAVLQPDGSVIIPGDQMFENLAAWEKEATDRADREAAVRGASE